MGIGVVGRRRGVGGAVRGGDRRLAGAVLTSGEGGKEGSGGEWD